MNSVEFFIIACPVAACVVGLILGIWARRTGTASRLGLLLIVAACTLAAALAWLIIYDKVRPHGDPDLGGLGLFVLGELICVPLTLIVGALAIITGIILFKDMTRKK